MPRKSAFKKTKTEEQTEEQTEEVEQPVEEVKQIALKKDKKPRKKRVVSEKEKRRRALIRQLMQENNCSLAEASKHIKQHNIEENRFISSITMVAICSTKGQRNCRIKRFIY